MTNVPGELDRVAEVLDHAAALRGAERAAYLREACGNNDALRAEVESLLKARVQQGEFLGEPTQAGAFVQATVQEVVYREQPGTRIGPYKLLQLIGEGGYGTVFMAEQEKPVSRKVALKVIKLGMDTKAVIARFEAERQALAMMDHPNIARVLDAGATETGRPYFVMELCKGEPIVEYCDRNNLSIQERLELFAQVCAAVQHAHTKGIIHRDLKPSNVLVTTQDGRPHAKVIDFGIAKATASKLTEKTLFTEHKALIGTPEYMSPEQAEGSLDIDTRTDVYSLGVLLYELLTGTTPFSGNDLRRAAHAEMQRIIREVEPPKPSTRISHNTDAIASVAAHRHTEPKKLGSIVRGELDWIVMKALEKDRARRYETANGLAMDIHRHLTGEAVLAAPPSKSYRVRKFVRRNQVVVTAGCAVAAALFIGVIAFAWQAKVARDERAEARKQAAIAEAVAKFQTDMLAAADPRNLRGEKVTVLQAIEGAVKKLDGGSLRDQPLVEAGVRETIGTTLYALARYSDAEPNLRRSLMLRRTNLPAGHPNIGISLNYLARLLQNQNKPLEAESLFREAVRNLRAALPADHPQLGTSLSSLAQLLDQQNRPAEAEPLFREALAIHRKALPAGDPEVAVTLMNFGALLRDQNRLAEAEPLLREALKICREALPARHPDIVASLNNLAMLLEIRNNPAEAESLYNEALEICRLTLPAEAQALIIDHRNPRVLNRVAEAKNNLARVEHALGKTAEARAEWREAIAMLRNGSPESSALLARVLWSSGSARLENKDAAAALLELEEAAALGEKFLPVDDPQLKECCDTLTKCKAALAEQQVRPNQ